MLPLTRIWFLACLPVLVVFGPDARGAAQERNDVQAAETKGEGVYDTVEGTTTIVSIKPIGSLVKKGELVCELESFAVQTRLTKQEIATRAAEAPYQYAKRAREIAELGVTEYIEGVYTPQLKLVEREIELVGSGLKRAEQDLATVKQLQAKGLGPQSYVDTATLNVTQAKFAFEKAQRKKMTLEKFTKERKVKELQSKVERARSMELARQAECVREQTVQEQLKKQIEHCKLLAPTSGRLIYTEVIEAGAEVRQGEMLFRVVPEAEPKPGK